MNKPTERIDEREWQMQERALREERFGAAAGDDPGIAAYRHVARALREPLPDALPSDFAEAIAAQAARLPVRGESALERWLVRLLYVAFVVSAFFVPPPHAATNATPTIIPRPRFRISLASWH